MADTIPSPQSYFGDISGEIEERDMDDSAFDQEAANLPRSRSQTPDRLSDHLPPNLVGTTGDLFQCSVRDTLEREGLASGFTEDPFNHNCLPNYFQSVQLSGDGTTLLTHNADSYLRTFVLPPDLLTSPPPRNLTPYSAVPSTEPVYACALYPFFDLSNPSTYLALSSPRDHPIRLSSLLPSESSTPTPPVATYPLVSPTTEASSTPNSLLFNAFGSQFIAGARDLIAFFDISRPYESPVRRLSTCPSRNHHPRAGGITGLVAALALSPVSDEGGSGLLAAGTYNRGVGLYDAGGLGESVATWSLSSEKGDEAEPEIGGRGVTQLLWSPCGRYLCVAERDSDGMRIYDIRVSGKLLGWLKGRNAKGMQRLGVAMGVCEEKKQEGGGCGNDIWAGGKDGMVRMWEGVGLKEGGRSEDWRWKGHDDPVTSVAVHPRGGVVMSCSGQRHDEGDEERDNRLKVWAL
ncbi:MAG: hypothetical protein M1834_004182 [Cirrosporium novae-zelandiae]|nr:MAG: hypothetical protein M1834_004182 [Cirrosporium novae-zelandiae]